MRALVLTLLLGCQAGGPRLAQGLTISDVALFQGVKLSLLAADAPVVAGRPGLLRVYVSGDAQPGPITAELRLDGAVKQLTQEVLNDSDETLESTFNFELAGDELRADSQWAVALYDTRAPVHEGPSPARWPNDGSLAALGAGVGGPLKVRLVPVRFDSDGSGRLPDTSADQLELIRRTLLATYPVTRVELEVREPLPWNQPFDFHTLNQALFDLRAADAPAPDVYYYGLVEPAATREAYCQNGCTTGSSVLVTNAGDAIQRVGSGLGYSGDKTAWTLVHELGHEHGRDHAPCMASFVDANYPYARGVTGVWGWDDALQALHPPSEYDFMGYCEPRWISDYTYRALYERVTAVNQLTGASDSQSLSLHFVDD